jgi:hypothetical protein
MAEIKDYIDSRIEEMSGDQECPPVGEYIETIAEEVRSKFGVQCDICECGGFDSPGYDITCYAMAWINKDGSLEMQDFQQESY